MLQNEAKNQKEEHPEEISELGRVFDKHAQLELIKDIGNRFKHDLTVKCEYLFMQEVDSHCRLQDQKIPDAGIRGLTKFTLEQKNWFLNKENISYHRENNFTYIQRTEDFKKNFPEAPFLSFEMLRNFYRLNNISIDELFREDYNKVNRRWINHNEDPYYLNGPMDFIPENSQDYASILNVFRLDHPLKLR